MKPRKPKDADTLYQPVADAAKWLEGLAEKLRAGGGENERVRIDVQLRFWTPENTK